jgi:VCBS repeat-containing protein
MSGNSNNAVPTEFAVKTYVDNNSGDKTVNYTSVGTVTYSTIRSAPRVTAMQDTTGINFTNVTYGAFGNVQLQTVVNSYQEIKAGVTKSVSLTYNETDGSIRTITVV